MISVAEALDRLFDLASPLGVEWVPLKDAAGRVLAQPVRAKRQQPPFDASAMDGYAVVSAAPGDKLKIIGESAAGHGFANSLTSGQTVRIFTGAPVPAGATRIVLQEDVLRDGDVITIGASLDSGPHIRPAGTDFGLGDGLAAPRRLSANDVALLAAMNIATVPVTRAPRVALMTTGDELVMPGEAPSADQIIASNTFGLHALLRDLGAVPRILPIARDTTDSLTTGFELVDDADLVLTIGGASVGDHDLVAPVTKALGMTQAFHKVAMRPGKPLMSGKLGSAMMIGLPGNPVSAMVCGHVFVAPVIRAMLGLPAQATTRQHAPLSAPIASNGPREHYMRATFVPDGLQVSERQDSSLLSVLSGADALVVRAPGDAARNAGDIVEYLPL